MQGPVLKTNPSEEEIQEVRFASKRQPKCPAKGRRSVAGSPRDMGDDEMMTSKECVRANARAKHTKCGVLLCWLNRMKLWHMCRSRSRTQRCAIRIEKRSLWGVGRMGRGKSIPKMSTVLAGAKSYLLF